MSKNTLLAIAAAITAIANDLNQEVVEKIKNPSPDPEPEPKPRGRPPKAAEKPADPEPEGVSLADLQAAIQPLVKDGRGVEVKALIKKHGADKLSEIPAANQAAFLKDIEALSY